MTPNPLQQEFLFHNPAILTNPVWPVPSKGTQYRIDQGQDPEAQDVQVKQAVLKAEWGKRLAQRNKLCRSAHISRLRAPMVPVQYCQLGSTEPANCLGAFGQGLPDFRHVFSHALRQCQEKKLVTAEVLRRAWPVCPYTGEPMQYIGWYRTDPWWDILAASQPWMLGTTNYNAFTGQQSLSHGWPEYIRASRIHIWTSVYNHYETLRPAACIKTELRYNELAGDKLDKLGTPEELAPIWQALQQQALQDKTDDGGFISPPNGFVSQVITSFMPDPLSGYLTWDYQKGNDVQFFGCPRSQQEPRRFLCPNPLPMLRAMTPFMSWNDPVEDMTYQLWVDTYSMPFHTVEGYMDASCT